MKFQSIRPAAKTRSIAVARRNPIATAAACALLGVALVAAGPGAAGASAAAGDAPQASLAKKGKKKHKKKHKKGKPPAPTQPAVTAPAALPSDPGDPGPADPPPDPEPAACAGEDDAEPDDGTGQATVLPYSSSYNDLLDRFRCPEDDDYFVVEIPADGYFHVDADPADGFDLALYAFVAGGGSESADRGGSGISEWVAINNIDGSAPVTAYIWVSGATSAETGAYTLRGYET